MQENEYDFYEKVGDWDFGKIKCIVEKITNWDFYEKIRENTDEKSLCLDLGTAGGENLLENYPYVGMIIGTDFSKKMINTAIKNSKKYPQKNVKFVQMNNLNITFPDELFDVISARNTIINAKELYRCVKKEGIVVIYGVDKGDCYEIKKLFGRGQAWNDKNSISEIDYNDLIKAGFKVLEKVEILENEYYKTKEDFMALLLKTPILNEFSEESGGLENIKIELDLFEKFVKENMKEKGILMKRKYYGIIAKK